jgi:penicillin-binding protein 1A
MAFGYLQNFGFTTLVEGEWRGNHLFTDKVASLPLGGLTDGVLQVELCAAYAAIANLGEYNKPVFYTRVLDHDGNVLLENRQEPRRVLRDTTAYMLTDMMKDTMTASGGTGSRFRFQEVKMPLAGKTGTSTDTKDLGFTGYTPYYTATIWKGFDQQKKIQDENSHRDLWRKIMEEIHQNLPEKQFERPQGIVSLTVCRDSGAQATDLCRRDPRGGRTATDIFTQTNQNVGFCEAHQELRICTVSGQTAGWYCNLWEMRVTVVSIDRPHDETNILDGDHVVAGAGIYGTDCTQCGYGQWPHQGVPDGGFSDIPGGLFSNDPQPPSIGDIEWNIPGFFAPPPATDQGYRPEFHDPIPQDFWDSQPEW